MAWECDKCGTWVHDERERRGCPVCDDERRVDQESNDETVWRQRWFLEGFEDTDRAAWARQEVGL